MFPFLLVMSDTTDFLSGWYRRYWFHTDTLYNCMCYCISNDSFIMITGHQTTVSYCWIMKNYHIEIKTLELYVNWRYLNTYFLSFNMYAAQKNKENTWSYIVLFKCSLYFFLTVYILAWTFQQTHSTFTLSLIHSSAVPHYKFWYRSNTK